MVEEDISTDIVETEEEESAEESPLLVAQRYLNIFHQIHIFKAAKKAEFDNELLNMPEKIKRLLISIPGGRILLEHILELEEQNGYDIKLTKALISQKKKADPLEEANASNSQALTPISGELTLGADFANTLAKSLATALGNMPQQQYIPVSGNVAPVSSDKQVNTQNNAAATTVNNIHVDYSIFQNLADAINKNNTQTHNDFMKVVDALSQNFNPTIVKADGIPLSAITSSLTQVIKESSRQQLEEMKQFSKMLTEAILSGNTNASGKISIPTKNYPEILGKKDEPVNLNADSQNSKPSISVINRKIDPITGKSTVQKTSYTAPVNHNPIGFDKPEDIKKNQVTQSQKAVSRAGINVKPVSLGVDDNDKSSFTETKTNAKPAYTEFALDENLNMHQTDTSAEEEWEYVDEYGNPISDSADGEWEYVDEYGNPISDSADGEWEYVDEYGNPISETETAPAPEPSKKSEPAPKPEKEVEEKKPETPKEPEPKEEAKSKVEEPEEKKEKETETEKPLEEKAEEKAEEKDEPAEAPKESLEPKDSKPAKSSGGLLSSLFKKKETAKAKEEVKEEAEEKIKEEAEKDSAENILAAAFGKPKGEAKEKSGISSDDILASAFNKTEDKPKDEPKKNSTADILASAFGKPAEEPKKDTAPRMGNILAQAYQEIEKEQKSLSSKDLLAQAFKNKPKTTAEVLNEAARQKENTSAGENKVDDALAAAFGEPKKETAPANATDDALAAAFGEPKKESADDALAAAFGEPKKETADDALAAAFGEPKKESADDALASAFNQPAKDSKPKTKEDEQLDALIRAFKS